ncbi:MAG TPA: hypothetical protein VHB72_01280 [Candidatus Saccharimonadales bacterium]|nr:hypothetical protein [Candidatus Saccharimonadales bacterium]
MLKNIRKSSLVTAGAVSISIIGAGLGVASAATNTPTSNMNGNVGTSGIPRSIFSQERLDAEAQVLNTTTANVQTARKNHTLKQLISQAGLTPETFMQKLKSQLTSDLESKGYSQDQITIALQHKEIVRLHHKADKEKKTNNKSSN